MAPTSQSTLRIAVLVIPPIQLLDLSPIDLFHMLSKKYLTDCKLPQPFIDLGLDDVRISYVAAGGPSNPSPSSSPSSAAGQQISGDNNNIYNNNNKVVLAEMTARAHLNITHGLDAKEVQPGQIDILLVPGPDPSLIPGEDVLGFIRRHADAAAASTTTVMSVCTGIIPLAKAGVLNGRLCTGPRALLGMFLKKDYPDARWVEKRWCVDYGVEAAGGKGKGEGGGELWTAGGITNGLDMVAAYLREKYPRELAQLVCAMADVGGRGVEYGNSSASEGMWWGWLLLRSWVGGLLGGRGRGRKGSGSNGNGNRDGKEGVKGL